ncbi:14694_t:CDS:2, partial [Entrophospora sp. SA101]
FGISSDEDSKTNNEHSQSDQSKEHISNNSLENTMLVDEDLEFVDTSNIIHPADDVEAK